MHKDQLIVAAKASAAYQHYLAMVPAELTFNAIMAGVGIGCILLAVFLILAMKYLDWDEEGCDFGIIAFGILGPMVLACNLVSYNYKAATPEVWATEKAMTFLFGREL